MATIKQRGPGGGKVRAKRVSRTWMIKTILSQQAQLDKFSQQVNELQASIDGLKAQIVPKEAGHETIHEFPSPGAFKPARLGTPAQFVEPQVTNTCIESDTLRNQ